MASQGEPIFLPSLPFPEFLDTFNQSSSSYSGNTEQDIEPQYTYQGDMGSNMDPYFTWNAPYLQHNTYPPHLHHQWSGRFSFDYQTLPACSSYDSVPLVIVEDTQNFTQSTEGAKIARSESRADSFASNTSNLSTYSSCISSPRSDMSRSSSPNLGEMAKWGTLSEQGTWTCAFPKCTSKSVFRRGCDLRKHFRRHTKSLYCRIAGCHQGNHGGFSSEKDRARHEAKHDPQIMCEFKDCNRLFSRMDNMVRYRLLDRKGYQCTDKLQRDHVRRIHRCRTTKKRTARKE